ncbi:collagen alpha-6(VI) chain-like [Liolophura sinensis]|uniref:collagen alpha-6(VI) chain-like n=1 Tax=Liolophura sinensis TaxID=3198878 RepID=UPI0031580266
MLKLCALLLLPAALAMSYYEDEAALDMIARDTSLKKGCGGKNADIAFVIDNSASIWSVDFYKQIRFVQDFVKVFNIAPDKVRIAAVSFADGVYYRGAFRFDAYKDEASVIDAISRIKYLHGSSTKTDEALDFLRTKVFPESLANPNRQDAARIGIVLTDGKSTYGDRTAVAAARVKKESKALMFAIGVGKKVSPAELHTIASGDDYVFQVDNYDALESIKNVLGIKICEVPTTPPPKEQPCGVVNPADVVLVYDSTEVGPSGISDIQRGVTAFVQTDEMQNPNMRVGLISGDCPEVGSFPLNRYTDKSQIPKLFDSLPYSELDALVGELRRDGFHPENGGRKNARHIGILIVTGKPQNPKAVRRQAAKAKKEGIELFVVGAGKVVDPGFLKSLASEPVESHIILGSDYSNFGLVGRGTGCQDM